MQIASVKPLNCRFFARILVGKTVVCELSDHAFYPRSHEGIQSAPAGLADKPLGLPRAGLTGDSLQAAVSRDPFFASFGLARKASLAQKVGHVRPFYFGTAASFLSIRLAGVVKAYHVEFALARAACFHDSCLRFLFLSVAPKHTTSAYVLFEAWRLEKKRYPSILSLVSEAHAWMLTWKREGKTIEL